MPQGACVGFPPYGGTEHEFIPVFGQPFPPPLDRSPQNFTIIESNGMAQTFNSPSPEGGPDCMARPDRDPIALGRPGERPTPRRGQETPCQGGEALLPIQPLAGRLEGRAQLALRLRIISATTPVGQPIF